MPFERFPQLHAWDVALFHAINGGPERPLVDAFIAMLTDAGNLVPIGAVILSWLFVRGSNHLRTAIIAWLFCLVLGDFLGESFKQFFDRPRPYWSLDARQIHGGPSFRSYSPSLPSNHALNNASMAACFTFFFPRLVVALPLAAFAFLIGFTRVYTGVHYPSDVLVGWAVGAMVGVAIGNIALRTPPVRWSINGLKVDWRAATIVLCLFVTFIRFGVLLREDYQLAAEETQYWTWSRQLDLSYYSKPPAIAWLLAATTGLFGSTVFGIRVLGFASSIVLLWVSATLTQRLFRDHRTTFLAVLGLNVLILYSLGALVITTDTPLMVFWALASLAAWLAIGEGKRWAWPLVALCIAAGLLSKYAMIYFPICLLLYLFCTREGRVLRKLPDPWLGITAGLLGFVPVLLWNARNGWVSFRHVAGQASSGKIEIGSFLEYPFSQAGVVGPGLFVVLVLALVLGSRRRWIATDRRLVFLLFLGVPVFVGLWAKGLQGKVLGNWAAPAYFTWTIAAAAIVSRHLLDHLSLRARILWSAAVVALPLAALVILHLPETWGSIVGQARRMGVELPVQLGPRYQFEGGKRLAKLTDKMLAEMPRPDDTFLFTKRYQEASLLQFYATGQPRTYNVNTGRRMNQFDIWGGFDKLAGQDALYVLAGSGDQYLGNQIVQSAFQHISEATFLEVELHEQVVREFTVYRCYGFRGWFDEPEKKGRQF
jgi:undecaprenyl-diphosphatase